MYPRRCVRDWLSVALATGTMLLWATSAPVHAAPVLRVASDMQCAVSLETFQPPARRDESVLSALGGGLLTSAADVFLDAGFNFIKTKLDPSKNQYSATIVQPYDGLFLGVGHNPALGCVMIAVFDSDEPGRQFPPIDPAQSFHRAPNPKSKFPLLTASRDRIAALFPGSTGAPLVYLELGRQFSPDGTAHYYKPVYAYAERMIRPHFLSEDPVWEISMGWKGVNGTAVSAWTYSFGGKAPLERGAPQLFALGQGWSALQNPPAARSAASVSGPVSIQLDITEHRTPALYSVALQKALADNEASAKQAVRDVYPWRRDDVAATAAIVAAKAQDDASQKVTSYLDELDKFESECKGTLSGTKKTRCGLTHVKLLQMYASLKDVVEKYKPMPSGYALPAPPPSP